MAKYDIVHLNYMSSGEKRAFINMDIRLRDESKIPIAVLRREEPRSAYDPVSSNIVLEQRGGHYLSTNVICKDYYEKFETISADLLSFIKEGDLWSLLSTRNLGEHEFEQAGAIYSLEDDGTPLSNFLCVDYDTFSVYLFGDHEYRQKFITTVAEVLSKQPGRRRQFDWWNHILSKEDEAATAYENMVYSMQDTGGVLCSDYLSCARDDDFTYLLGEQRELKSGEQLVLDEIQDQYVESVSSDRPFFRLMLTSDTQEYKDNFYEFKSNHIAMPGQTYVYDAYVDQCGDNVNAIAGQPSVKALYDIVDLAVKSDGMVANSALPKMDQRKTEDVYVPQDSAGLVGFVGCGDTSYLMFGRTEQSEKTIGLSLKDSRTSEEFASYYTGGLASQSYVDTYLYKSPSAVAAGQDFSPRLSLRGIGYNYIASVGHDGNCFGTYTNGNLYGGICHLKNAFDANYTMSMSSETGMRNCRSYCGIGEDRNNIYLKYYDNVDYSVSRVQLSTETFGVSSVAASVHEKLPYQKIEYFIPNGITNTTKHKTNFFSVRLCNSDLGSSDPQYQTLQFKQLKKDITNAIKEICDNISPANTQLFEVQFSGEGSK